MENNELKFELWQPTITKDEQIKALKIEVGHMLREVMKKNDEIADLKRQLEESNDNVLNHQNLAFEWMKKFDSRQKELGDKTLQLVEAQKDTERLRKASKHLIDCLNTELGVGITAAMATLHEAIDAAKEDK